LKVNRSSKEFVASIFRIEEQAKQETESKQSPGSVYLFFDPEDGSCMSLQNVGWLSAVYTPLYPRG
jgi:hypothetical protein